MIVQVSGLYSESGFRSHKEKWKDKNNLLKCRHPEKIERILLPSALTILPLLTHPFSLTPLTRREDNEWTEMNFLGLSGLNVSHFPCRALLGIAEASFLSCTQQVHSAVQVTGHLVPRLLKELQMAPGDPSGLVGFVLASSKHPRTQ